MEQANATSTRQVLTTGKCLRALAFSVCFALAAGAISLSNWRRGERLGTMGFAAMAVGRLMMMPGLWRRYVAVRNGAIIYIEPQQSTQVSRLASIVVVSLLTLLVGAATLGLAAVFIRIHPAHSFEAWIGFLLVAAALWAYVGFCWYRIAQEKPAAAVRVEYDPPQEGVWPPPPQVPVGENKDLTTR